MGGRRQAIFTADGEPPFRGGGWRERVSNREPLSCDANEPLQMVQTMPAPAQPQTHPSAAILLTRCFVHSFSHTQYLMLTAVNFKQPFCVCFSNFVYADCFSILGGWKPST